MKENVKAQVSKKTIKCPFYHSENFNSVCCEGNIEGSSIRQIFRGKKQKDEWQKKFCVKVIACTECPIYRMANEKYDV
jgi:hypothetical protein